MLKNVATIVSGQQSALTPAITDKAAGLLKSIGVERLEIASLAPGRAADVFFSGDHPGLHANSLLKLMEIGGFDIFVQANDQFRKKKLLVADMDATIIVGETLDELAARFGLADQVVPITQKAMRGEIDFREALAMRVGLLKGRPVSALHEALADVRFSRGAAELVRTMNRQGGKCMLVSGGFDLFTGYVAAALGFCKNIGNRLGVDGDVLTGEALPPIVDKDAKKRALEAEARLLQLDLRHVVAVGDGANDIPMLQTAGVGVGYFGKPAVQAATPHQIRYSDLTALLYMQGYRKEEIPL